jgi:DNA-binding IclR family transcriptional regulator
VITGTALSMLTTGSGRVFGAYLPSEKYEHLIVSELASPDLPDEFRSRSQVTKLFTQIRKAGVAVIDSKHFLQGISAVTVPVFNAANEITLAMSVVGFQGVLDTSLNGPIVSALKASALKLSKKLGYRDSV